jgi:signal recognition particle subunit SRP68
MHLKSLTAEDPTSSASGATKRHVISRFHKAHKHASELVALLSAAESNATSNDLLEATAYASAFKGSEAIEKERWEVALQAFAISRIIYSALLASAKSEAIQELLTDIVDPSIRFAAYKLQLPRNMDIAAISRQYFPHDQEARVVSELGKLDPQVFAEPMETNSAAAGAVTSVTWRGRTAPVEEADISIKLSDAQTAEAVYGAQDQRGSTDAFDAVLLAWQNAVDSTRKAIDERQAEGMTMGEQKMQNLQLTWTVVNYSMICWRVGRNRVMISNIMSGPKKPKKDGTEPVEEISGRKLGHLKEEIALYDAILQVHIPNPTLSISPLTVLQKSLEQIANLPGVAADETFTTELNSKASFFRALRTSSIARSHALLGNRKNALALFHRAHQYISGALPLLPTQPSESSHRGLEITSADARSLHESLAGEVARYRALVEMDTLAAKAGMVNEQHGVLLERLDQWPNKVDFTNGIVQWPPKVQPVPVKPLFLDIAWNFIEYPGTGTVKKQEAQQTAEKEAEDKKGLLGRLWGR